LITLSSLVLKMTAHLTQGHKKAQKAPKTFRDTSVHFVPLCGYTSPHAEKKPSG